MHVTATIDEAASLCVRLAEAKAEATALWVCVEQLEREVVECDELLFMLLVATQPGDTDLHGSEEPDGLEVEPFPSPAFIVASVSVLGPLPSRLPRSRDYQSSLFLSSPSSLHLQTYSDAT